MGKDAKTITKRLKTYTKGKQKMMIIMIIIMLYNEY